jgi:putative ABC transport system permease protein
MGDALRQEIRIAARALRRSPGFTLTAVLTLALGIGLNGALFSVLNAVVLRPLPYAAPDRVVGVWNSWDDTPRASISPAEYFDYRDQVASFEHFGVYTFDGMTLTQAGDPERLPVGVISHGVLTSLGIEPQLGRVFTAQDDPEDAEAVVLLSDGLWRRKFGTEPGVVGGRIWLNRRPFTVAGVLPAGFRLPQELESSDPSQAFVPLGLDRTTVPIRGAHFLTGVARLRAGVSRDQAAADIGRVAARFATDLPNDYPPAMRFAATVTPLAEDVVGDVRPLLLVLLGAVGFVLLIACANIANLFLSRGERRHHEFGVRTALGASRRRLMATTMTESALVAVGGGIAGVACASAATKLLLALRPAGLPRLETISFDWTVLLFLAATVSVVAVLVGAVPALRGARAVSGAAHADGRGSTNAPRHVWVRGALVASEVGLSIVLLMGAGLAARSLWNLLSVDPGYRTDRVLTASITLPVSAYPDPERTSRFFATLLDRLRAQPGITAAGAVTRLPLADRGGDLNFQIEGRETPQGTRSRRADWQVVTPGYFDSMGMRIMAGRGIEPSDLAGSPGVIVFNESAARLHWPDGDALGRRLRLGGRAGPGLVTVVGIVNDVRTGDLTVSPRPEMYLAHTQFRMFGTGTQPMRSLSLTLRTSVNPTAVASALRREVAELDPNLSVDAMRTMADVRASSVSMQRFVWLLLGTFAGVALMVSVIGVYGVMAYSVSQRRREIGVRMALGATARSVIGLVLRQGLAPAALGLSVGLPAGLLLSRTLQRQLYGISPADPVTATGTAALMAAAAFLACFVAARRAARIDPQLALRAE